MAVLLRTVGRCHGARKNQVLVDVRAHVLLVSVESLALTLPAMPHVGILDGDTTIGSDSSSDLNASLWSRLDILLTDLL
jgi:hypothetical protein